MCLCQFPISNFQLPRQSIAAATSVLGVGRWELGIAGLINNALDEPGIRVAFAEDAIGRPVAERHIPLIALPRFHVHGPRLARILFLCVSVSLWPVSLTSCDTDPPSARRAPGAGICLDVSPAPSTSIGDHPHGHAAIDPHARGNGKPETTNRDDR